MVRVLATRVFSVIGRDDDDEKIPRIPLRHVSSSRAIDLLRLHGFVIVTSLGTELESRLEKLREAMTSFFALPVDKKEECVGGVYVSERGVPMYRVGFESQERIRECFRIELRNPLYPEGARTEWQRVLGPLRRIADKVLCASLQSPPKTGDDFSIAYSFLYPNSEQYGLLDAPHTLVKEHADPSLVVISPISYVDGLDVFDPATKRWISIESNGTPGRELVLFAGKALEHAAGFPACVHRVLKRQRPRLSFIYEQKYGDYFTHTRHFGD